jgi:hypothetical protein
MSINILRVINQQTLPQGLSRRGSILLDKIDVCQGNSENPPYAQNTKQPLYVPWANPLNTAVKGYVDLIQTDEVKLQAEAKGSIGGLLTTVPARLTTAVVSSALIAAPILTSVNHASPVVLVGLIFLSVAPDLTYVEITNLSGVKQLVPQSAFTGGTVGSTTTVSIPLSSITIGVPAAGWKYRVFANSKFSSQVVAS